MVATRFMDPVIIDKDEFMKRWNALSDKDREQQEVWNSKSPIDSARMEDIKSRIIVNGIKLGQATGLDQNEYTLSACGTFRTGTVAPNGTKISVGCLIRLEANPQATAFRLTVRAVHAKVSVALKNVIKSQIG